MEPHAVDTRLVALGFTVKRSWPRRRSGPRTTQVTSPTFVPGATPPDDLSRALYAVFRGEELLAADGGLVASPEALGVAAARTFFVGTWGDRPVFAVLAVEPTPPDLRFVPLRAALLATPADRLAPLACASQVLRWDKDHRFCGRCGKPVADVPGERARRCASCGLDAYPRIAPCAIVLVHDGDRILLARRPNAPWFALVAGFLESGETLEECAAREVLEETGLVVDSVRYFGSQPWPFPHQLMVAFFARYASGAIAVDGRELDEARFFTRAELPALPPSLSIARRMIDAWIHDRV